MNLLLTLGLSTGPSDWNMESALEKVRQITLARLADLIDSRSLFFVFIGLGEGFNLVILACDRCTASRGHAHHVVQDGSPISYSKYHEDEMPACLGSRSELFSKGLIFLPSPADVSNHDRDS